jgi:tripartite-type tricarboxylate transporter receptor subunit TctC
MNKWIGALIVLGCLTEAAAAQTQYPSRPINIVVTAAAGGVTDVVARAVGQQLSERWKTQVIIENKGGAAHVLGAQAVARATPDGQTLMIAEAGTFTINPTLYAQGRLPYDAEKDFIPVTGLVRINQALLAKKDLPVNTPGELIALAKQKPDQLTFGTAGVGSAPHMNIELFENMSGVKLVPVHYRGAAPALNDLIAGHIDLMSVSISLALPPSQANKIKLLGIGSAKRLPQIADIPTVAEGGLPGYQAVTWFGLFATAGTPHDIVMKLNNEVREIFNDPKFQERFMAPQFFEPMVGPPEEFAEYIKSETKKWGKVIHDAKMHID